MGGTGLPLLDGAAAPRERADAVRVLTAGQVRHRTRDEARPPDALTRALVALARATRS